MTLLLMGNKKTKYFRVFSPDTYSSASWSSNPQDDLVKLRKNWYWIHRSFDNEYYEGTFSKMEAPVILETTNPSDIFTWVYQNCSNHKVEILKILIDDLEQIFKDWISIKRFILGESK